jgi:hypothetical protein
MATAMATVTATVTVARVTLKTKLEVQVVGRVVGRVVPSGNAITVFEVPALEVREVQEEGVGGERRDMRWCRHLASAART